MNCAGSQGIIPSAAGISAIAMTRTDARHDRCREFPGAVRQDIGSLYYKEDSYDLRL